MAKTFLDIHVLQSVPPSNINRDETGAPKTAFYGGVRRARVSSQAWKRATRTAFADFVDDSQLGVRTQRVVEQISEKIEELDSSLSDQADDLATGVLNAVGIKIDTPKKPKKSDEGDEAVQRPESAYLVFFSNLQIEKAARQAIEDHQTGTKPAKKTYKDILQSDNSLDIALFGRMIADLTDLGVDSATQVAHALSVHAVESEADFYTAVDDYKQNDPDRDAGAGMLGTIEFNSSTLYRYATVSLEQLHTNLGSTAAVQTALNAFARGFVLSMPTGKVNTFANGTLPAGIVFSVRTDRPVSFVEAFEDPIVHDGGYVEPAVANLVTYAQEVEETFAAPVGYWTAGTGARSKLLDELSARTSIDVAAQGAVAAAVARFTDGSGGGQ